MNDDDLHYPPRPDPGPADAILIVGIIIVIACIVYAVLAALKMVPG